MIAHLVTACTPTPENITNWLYFGQLLLGVVAVLYGTYWLLDHGLDGVSLLVRRRTRTQTPVVDFSEARRRRVLDAVVRR